MKFISLIRLLPLFCVGVLHTTSTNLLPGIIYYDGTEKLSGKLVFLVQHDGTVLTNSANAATVYEFDLQKKRLNKIIDSPVGQFGVSTKGNVFCTIFWNEQFSMGKDTNVFVYLESSKSSYWTNIESSPQGMFVADDRIYLKLEGYNFPSAGYYLVTNGKATDTKLIEYDFEKNQMRTGDFSVQWQNYESSYDFKAFDGRYIFFEGKDAPTDGLTLISSPWDYRNFEDQDPKGKKTKVLHKFSMFSVFTKTHELLQLSPDCHFALVRSIDPIGSTTSFYLVDVTTGKTRLLLENKTEAATKNLLWNGFIYWVGAAE